jgi:hypothetical protein
MQNNKTNPHGRNDTMNTPDTIAEHKIDVDLCPGGYIETYGAGVAHTPYDAVYIGRGRSEREAAEDALEMLAQDLPRIEGGETDTWGMDRIEEAIEELSDSEKDSQEFEAECFQEFCSAEGIEVEPDTVLYEEALQRFYDSSDDTFELSAALYVRFGYPETREDALARFLGCSPNDVEEHSHDYYSADGEEYRVLTDWEADEAAAEYIAETLWAFNPEFLTSYVPNGVGVDVLMVVQEQCEAANCAIRSMIDAGSGFDSLVSDAIGADGRGHFLASYDGNEDETDGPDGETLYIYRI